MIQASLRVVGDDAVAGDEGHLRSPGGGYGVLWQLDDVDAAGFRLAEDAGHVLELAASEGGELGGAGLALLRDVGVDVADPGGSDGREEFTGYDGAGEAGFRPDEAELVSSVRQRFLGGRPATDCGFIGGDADVHLGGEAVGEETGHREPAAGVEQDADGVGYGGEFDAFDGAGLGAYERAGVLEVEGGGGAFGERGEQRDVDGGVGGEALGVECRAFAVREFGDAEAVVELEGGGGEVFEGGEGDVGGGGEPVDGGVEIGGDDVAGDVELRAGGRGRRGPPGGNREGADGEERGGEGADGGGDPDSADGSWSGLGGGSHAFENPQLRFNLECNGKAVRVILDAACWTHESGNYLAWCAHEVRRCG